MNITAEGLLCIIINYAGKKAVKNLVPKEPHRTPISVNGLLKNELNNPRCYTPVFTAAINNTGAAVAAAPVLPQGCLCRVLPYLFSFINTSKCQTMAVFSSGKFIAGTPLEVPETLLLL